MCDTCRYVSNPKQEMDAFEIYGKENCKTKPDDTTKDSFAAEILEMLLQMYYSN